MGNDSDNSAYAIKIEGLTKSFGGYRVLRGIDLKVKKGECLAVFGPNGAGKTTLIKVLATLSKPAKGTVQLAGMDIKNEAVNIRRRVGVISHQTLLYDNLTAYENLKFYGKMYDVPNLEQRIIEVIEQVDLKNRLHDRVGSFSRGMQQRLSIARAILHNPAILLMDEPETGLDLHASAKLGQLLKTLGSGEKTVFMTTHNLGLGLELSDRIMILHKGRIVYHDSTLNMKLPSLRESYNLYTRAEA
ncbi:MAG: ABC transporter ATP-binding protein [Chloroflexota bacterium]|nr:ABC transporter ATP-binding protein [Chloroflexota bacterium]